MLCQTPLGLAGVATPFVTSLGAIGEAAAGRFGPLLGLSSAVVPSRGQAALARRDFPTAEAAAREALA